MSETEKENLRESGGEEPRPRRWILKFFSPPGLAFLALAGGLSAAGAAFFRFFFPNALFEPPGTVKVGYPEDYDEIGKVYTQWKEHLFWLVRTAEGIYALSAVCTHLGCVINWWPSEERFKCPCHGSGFYKSGINYEGPAPRPLERFRIFRAQDGRIVVDTRKVFRRERGEWNDPEAFLPL